MYDHVRGTSSVALLPQTLRTPAAGAARPQAAPANAGSEPGWASLPCQETRSTPHIDIIRRTLSHADQELLVRADIEHRHRAPSRPLMTRHLINTCALLTLGFLLIIWLRSRLVVLAPRRVWSPSPPDVVLGPLPVEVEWRVAVGCGFSGFFVEVALGFMLPLASSGSFRLLCGKCGEDFLTGQLTVKEADAIRKTWADESARTPAQTRAAIVIEHGEPCGIRRWSASDRPLWVISRTMTEGDLAPEQADCLRAADEVLPTPCSRRPARRAALPDAPWRPHAVAPCRPRAVFPIPFPPHTTQPAVLPAKRRVRGAGPAPSRQACAPAQVARGAEPKFRPWSGLGADLVARGALRRGRGTAVAAARRAGACRARDLCSARRIRIRRRGAVAAVCLPVQLQVGAAQGVGLAPPSLLGRVQVGGKGVRTPHPPRPATPSSPRHTLLAPPHGHMPARLGQARAASHQDVLALVGGRAERSQRVARHLCRRAGAAPPPRPCAAPAPLPRPAPHTSSKPTPPP